MAPDPAPLTPSEADHLLAPLGAYTVLLLAVSGGPDSLALLLLASAWRNRLGTQAPRLEVASVDHGLRAGSRAEAEMVARVCRGLALPHHLLTWDGPKPQRNVAEAARHARYGLLEQCLSRVAGADGHGALVTAHHMEDQAETLLMRLARGAGVRGLGSMRSARPLSDGGTYALVRPLLGVPRARLAATLAQAGWVAAHDPGNADPAQERVRWRHSLPALATLGLPAAALALAAQRLAGADEALQFAARAFSRTLALDLHEGVFASFSREAFAQGPAVLRQIVLADLIAQFGGTTAKPTLSEIERLDCRLSVRPGGPSDSAGPTRSTLGGTTVSAGPRTVRIWREAARVDALDRVLNPDAALLWDGRFWITCHASRKAEPAKGPLVVRACGRDSAAARAVSATAVEDVPAAAVAALPSVWCGGTLLAVPRWSPLGFHMLEPGSLSVGLRFQAKSA